MRIYVLTDVKIGYVHSILPYYNNLLIKKPLKLGLPVNSRITLTLVKKILINIPNVEGTVKNLNFWESLLWHIREIIHSSAWKRKQVVEETRNCQRNICCDDTVGITRPIIAINYMKKIRAVDRADQYAPTYYFLKKSLFLGGYGNVHYQIVCNI